MAAVPLYLVDAFAERPFTGNPAGVCLLDRERPAAWMQAVAMEMNQAETAFLLAAGGGYALRWFTPRVEVNLCGHATLASAHILFETGVAAEGEPIRFATASGELVAAREGDRIRLDFPATPPQPASEPAGLVAALGLEAPPRFVGRSRFDLLVEVADEQAVRAVRPDFAKIGAIDARGVMVAARAATAGIDFVSRFFAPQSGVDEDSVTGSAHCALAPYFGGLLGKTEMIGLQVSRRGGQVGVRLRGDRVDLVGRAITVLRGGLGDGAGDVG